MTQLPSTFEKWDTQRHDDENSDQADALEKKRDPEEIGCFRSVMEISIFIMALLTTLALLPRGSHAFLARMVPRRQLSRGRVGMTSNSQEEQKLVQDMLYRVRQVNHMPEEVRSTLLDFQVDGIKLGKVRSVLDNFFHIQIDLSQKHLRRCFPIPRSDPKQRNCCVRLIQVALPCLK
jgi:hypothetical protein